VEESFAEIPRLHPGVRKVIPVAIRRWRKNLTQSQTWREIADFRQQLQSTPYDLVIDTQGLLKSALLCRLAQCQITGYEKNSIREPLASLFYQKCYAVAKTSHAVVRNRQLVARALDFTDATPADYGIQVPQCEMAWLPAGKYAVLLSATSRDDKLWPEAHWIELARILHQRGKRILFPSGSPRERERAQRLADKVPNAIVAPSLSLTELTRLLAGAEAVVGVDTGLSHLAVAVNTPTVAIYTATDPDLTGVFGSGFYRNIGGRGIIPSVPEVISALSEIRD
jgi:heptosyltransferase-1